MPTTKRRINISVPAHIERALTKISRRDHIPVATKALNLIQTALEIEEDIVPLMITRNHGTKNVKWETIIDFSEINPDGVPAEKILRALKKIKNYG